MQAKTPDESAVEEIVYKIFPNDLNSENTVFGGTVLGLLDRTALVVSERHSSKSCVTVSVDAVRFLAPGRKGDNLLVAASINRWGKPCTVPEVSPVTEEERRRYEEAGIRRSLRINAANERKERQQQRTTTQQSKM